MSPLRKESLELLASIRAVLIMKKLHSETGVS